MPVSSKRRRARDSSGKLRIGDDWNAINIIALSQSNPLKAVAEFVEKQHRCAGQAGDHHPRSHQRPIVSENHR
jgi:hypothetical protein